MAYLLPITWARRYEKFWVACADVLEPQCQRAFSTREPVNVEVSATLPTRTKPGRWIAHYLPIPDAAGEITRVAAVVVETTAQKKPEDSLRPLGGNLRNEAARLQMLLDVSSIMASNWDLPQAFPRISARIRRLLRHEYAGVELHDANTGLLVRQAEDFPLGKGLLSASPISPLDSPGGRALSKRAPLIFSKHQMQDFDADIAKTLLAEGLQSLCCVPLLRPNGALGVLVLGSTRKDAFHPEDLTVLNQVAAQFAVALENHRSRSKSKS